MIKAIITDFDGTLADTFEANYAAYREAFAASGAADADLSRTRYRACYGLRFDAFMERMGITDAAVRQKIRQAKAEAYPKYFGLLRVNQPLASLIEASRASGMKTAIASTARRENLLRVLEHIGLTASFDVIIAGEMVREGKPNPEIYNRSMTLLGVRPEETLIFEDSEVGLEAAARSGASYIKITQEYFK